MKLELTKPVVRMGNSAGVLLPKKWINGEAHIQLIHKPIEFRKDIFEILDSYLEQVIGIYITGSYARNEQTKGSDVDVLVITEKENRRISRGRYDLALISLDELKKKLKENILPLLPMLKEAKPILNSSLIEEYKNTKLTKKNLRFHIDTTKSAMKINKGLLELDEKENEDISDNILYPLILRLRELYIVDCLMKNKKPTKKGILALVWQITGSGEPYQAYIRLKNEEKLRKVIPIEQAEKLYAYIIKKIKEQERWIERKD